MNRYSHTSSCLIYLVATLWLFIFSASCLAHGVLGVLLTQCLEVASAWGEEPGGKKKKQLYNAWANLFPLFFLCISSCQDLKMQISLLQEQISHLQCVIHSQHQNLRSVIQEVRLIKRASLVAGMFTVRRLNTSGLPGLYKQWDLFPTDTFFLCPCNKVLFSIPSFVCIPTPEVLWGILLDFSLDVSVFWARWYTLSLWRFCGLEDSAFSWERNDWSVSCKLGGMLGQGCHLAILWEHPDQWKRRGPGSGSWMDGGLYTQTIYFKLCIGLGLGGLL